MRIFYAADHEPFPGNNLWHNNLYLPLVDLGHQVISFDYDLTPHFLHADPAIASHAAFVAENRPLLEQSLLKQIEAAHKQQPIDLFFSYFYSAFCRPEIIQEIRNMGICTVNWYCNASYQLHLVEEIAPAYDYCLVPEKFRLDDYHRLGANPIYCQEAANPNIYKPHDLPVEFDVTFVGQKYGTRPLYILSLLEAGVDVRVWGQHWVTPPQKVSNWRRRASRIKRFLLNQIPPLPDTIPLEYCGSFLSDEDLVKIYSRSKISLGFTSVALIPEDGSLPIKQVRLRDFEATMSGAFYMVEYFEELIEFFEPDKEIVCFSSREELVDKTRYYLEHSTEREQIRQAGMSRARNDHTWHKRFKTVFEVMGLIKEVQKNNLDI